jgi:hypothetical protein
MGSPLWCLERTGAEIVYRPKESQVCAELDEEGRKSRSVANLVYCGHDRVMSITLKCSVHLQSIFSYLHEAIPRPSLVQSNCCKSRLLCAAFSLESVWILPCISVFAVRKTLNMVT